MELPTLDIVIVNWNAGMALRRCLESIGRARRDEFRLSRVCIVDNASTDASVNGIGDLDLPYVVQRNSANRGFAAACNQGAHGSVADYLLFLNPDTRLTPASLSAPTRFMEEPRNRDIGICGIPLLNDGGEPGICCAAFPSALFLCAESCGLHRFIGRRFESYLTAPQASARRVAVDQVIGAFFLVRASVFAKLGGFDDRFFMYFEEVDFSRRALAGGYTSCIVFETPAYHTGSVSSGRVQDRRLFYYLWSKLQYARKHFSLGGQILVGIFTLCVEPGLRLLHGVCTGSIGGIAATIRGYGCLWSKLLARLLRALATLKRVATRLIRTIIARALVRTGLCTRTRITAAGCRLVFHPSSMSRALWIDPETYSQDVDFYRRYLRAGDVFVDVGANIGYYTILGAKLVGMSGKVLSIEPNPIVYEYLAANVSLNGLTTAETRNVAAGAQPGHAALKLHPRDDTQSCIGVQGDYTVPILPLDAIVGEEPSVALVKIDVEGYEQSVVEGATRTLGRTNCMYFEVSPEHYSRYGATCAAVTAVVRALGFSLFYHQGRDEIAAYDAPMSRTKCENIIAVRDLPAFLARTGYAVR
jgi:hypothetical protein